MYYFSRVREKLKTYTKTTDFWAPASLILFCIGLCILYVYVAQTPLQTLQFVRIDALEQSTGSISGIVTSVTQKDDSLILRIESYCSIIALGQNASVEIGDFVSMYGESKGEIFFYEWLSVE
jgi:hypothetical protein